MGYSDRVWTPRELRKLFRSHKDRQTLFRKESAGIIPKAQRVERGKVSTRAWAKTDLPKIGQEIGFLTSPTNPQVMSIYCPKGGVMKTSLTYNLARILALHNINTLVIGLDIQCSITDMLTFSNKIETIDELEQYPGIFESADGQPVERVIQVADIPTLHFIPENKNLSRLESMIRNEDKREYWLHKFINPLKRKYDVILFDNGPNWNFLAKNSLVASNNVIIPVGCDIGTYRAIDSNIDLINEYSKVMNLQWDNFIIIPTLLERTKLSNQIEAGYKTQYPKFVTDNSIRRATKGQESLVKNVCIFEIEPNSQLANDYFEIITEIWNKITTAGS